VIESASCQVPKGADGCRFGSKGEWTREAKTMHLRRLGRVEAPTTDQILIINL
jgi:hypothetical protein